MRVGIAEIILLALIFIILFGPFLFQMVRRLERYFSGRAARLLVRLEGWARSLGRAVRIGAVSIVVFLILFELTVYFMTHR